MASSGDAPNGRRLGIIGVASIDADPSWSSSANTGISDDGFFEPWKKQERSRPSLAQWSCKISHQDFRRCIRSDSIKKTICARSLRNLSPLRIFPSIISFIFSFILFSTLSRKALSISRIFMAARKSLSSLEVSLRFSKYSSTSVHCWCRTLIRRSDAPELVACVDLLRSRTIPRRRSDRSFCLRKSASWAAMLCFSLSVSALWSRSVMRVFLFACTNSSTSASCSSSFLLSAPAFGAMEI
mmetsp:Transcript_4450/g.10375  ORF Transcript_4450/g.10375 Transcript_4450/m.10375 type:complete len:241 (-) Transcript_4450:373-1095(-)